jgi:hypothetical protein
MIIRVHACCFRWDGAKEKAWAEMVLVSWIQSRPKAMLRMQALALLLVEIYPMRVTGIEHLKW